MAMPLMKILISMITLTPTFNKYTLYHFSFAEKKDVRRGSAPMTGLIESPFFPGPFSPPSFYAVNRDVYSYEITSTVAQEHVVVEFQDWNLDPSSTFSVKFQYSL